MSFKSILAKPEGIIFLRVYLSLNHRLFGQLDHKLRSGAGLAPHEKMAAAFVNQAEAHLEPVLTYVPDIILQLSPPTPTGPNG